MARTWPVLAVVGCLATLSCLVMVVEDVGPPSGELENRMLRRVAEEEAKSSTNINLEEKQKLKKAIDVLERAITAELRPDCMFEENVDVEASAGDPEPVLDSDKFSCCSACAARPDCRVAVLSASTDSPPNACWLKRSVKRLPKQGVVACLPISSPADTPREQQREEQRPGEERPGPGHGERPGEQERRPGEQQRRPGDGEQPGEGECRYVEDTDMAGLDGEAAVEEETTRERCCELCRREGSCVAAVLSSQTDTPANACWLKFSSGPLLPKAGVTTCLMKKSTVSETRSETKLSREERAAKIREAIRHAWRGYEEKAFGRDSVMPISGRATSSGFDMAVTLVDSLDTLYLAGLTEEFKRARDFVASAEFQDKMRRPTSGASFFETTIRVLGGLLGAYALTDDPVFKTAADSLGTKMAQKIDNKGAVPTSIGGMASGGCPSLAHAGTTQLEFGYLADITNKPDFKTKSMKFYEYVFNRPNFHGLYSQCAGAGSGKLSMGAENDSFYEYLLKTWLLHGHPELRRAYDDAVDAMETYMTAEVNGFTFLDNLDWSGGEKVTRDRAMEHLACFVPGWLALGAHTDPDAQRAHRRFQLAGKLAETCFEMYRSQPTGIAPERVKKRDLSLRSTDTREYILRPEAVESWWYLAELSPSEDSSEKYRDWGWQVFSSIDSKLRVKYGHASLRDVSSPNSQKLDRMESFWLAETLKYLFLLQAPSNTLPLSDFVLNTEAHPFRILHQQKTSSS